MGVFGRPAPSVDDLDAYVPVPPKLRVLRADGARIDLTSRDSAQHLVATKQQWQSSAFAYRDMIGELRYAMRLLSRAVSRVRFYPAENRPYPLGPVPLDGDEHTVDPQLAADAIHNFTRLPLDSNPDGFTARLVDNLSIAGESWVHLDAEDQFWVRSTSEITASADGRVVLNTLPSASQGSTRQIDSNVEDLLRMWIPHPEWGQLADSPMRSLLDVAEDVVLAGREARAAARSRVAANGILLMPASLDLARDRGLDEDDEILTDTFMADFTTAMLAPIRDDGDPQAVVPIVIRGDIEDLDKVRHLSMQRADSAALIARQSTAIMRLLKGLDVQPEQVEGVGGMNHWGAFIIDSRSIRDQIEPMAETVAACLVQAFLRPALTSLNHQSAQVGRITIGVDVTPLAENPNRGQDARDAHHSLVISDATLRAALGFDDDDAPSDEEKLRRLAASGSLPVGVTATLFGLSQQDVKQAAVIEGQIDPDTEAEAVAARSGPKALPAVSPAAPERATPPRTEPPVVAAGAPEDDEWRVDVELARRLADIDAALLDRIAVAADAAIARVVERAGARVRSAAQRDRAVVASLAGVDVTLIPSWLGRAQVEAFVSVADLLEDGYGRLRGQVTRWLADAAVQAADVVLKLLGLNRRSGRGVAVHAALVARLTENAGRAWPELARVLDVAVERALFAPDPLTPEADGRGEPVETLIRPREVADVLAVAGGGTSVLERTADPATPTPPHSPGGYTAGPTVQQVMADEGAVLLGWEWQYRPEIPRDTFDAHQQLDGQRFATWTDPKLDTGPKTAWLGLYFHPQDHGGCRCTATPVYAYPELDNGIVARRLREAAGNPRNILAGQIARDDDRAGRVGTSLQNEVEVRDRIVAAVERLTREYIERTGS